MNLELFNNLMKQPPAQHPQEWRLFLEICELYLERQKIRNPIVVELGIYENRQKAFWEKLFGAEHIGIDVKKRRCIPDIVGNTHYPETLKILKEKLKGRPINILFIDANHHYEAVKEDFEIYSPLCDNIVVIHDIESRRYDGPSRRKRVGVWKFWDELRVEAYKGKEEYKNFLFLSIYQYFVSRFKIQTGIGMIIKK